MDQVVEDLITAPDNDSHKYRCNGNAVNDLQIAGADGIFHPASGRVAGGKLVVTCDNVTEPVAVRYCQSNYCEGNLYNSDDLPAYPFVMKIE